MVKKQRRINITKQKKTSVSVTIQLNREVKLFVEQIMKSSFDMSSFNLSPSFSPLISLQFLGNRFADCTQDKSLDNATSFGYAARWQCGQVHEV